MPETTKLLRAVVEIGTQLRRIADAQTTPVALGEMTTVGTCDASLAEGMTGPLGPCVLRHQHDGPVHQDADGARWSTVVRAVDKAPTTTTDDAPHLRQLIADALENADYRPDMRRGDLADAVVPVIMSIGRTLRSLHHSAEEDATVWAQRAVTAAKERDQLAAVLREVLGLFTPALVDGKYAFYQATESPIAPQDYQRWHAALQPPATEEQPGPTTTREQ